MDLTIVTAVDPEGKPEFELAVKYNKMAETAEKEGYSRYAETMRDLASSYIKEAEDNIQRHQERIELEE